VTIKGKPLYNKYNFCTAWCTSHSK